MATRLFLRPGIAFLVRAVVTPTNHVFVHVEVCGGLRPCAIYMVVIGMDEFA